MKPTHLLLSCSLSLVTPGLVAFGDTAPAADTLWQTVFAAPTPLRSYKLLPYDENWRWLAAQHADSDPFDPLKYIPLSPDGNLSLSVGGSARYRFEYKINPGFGAYTPTTQVNPTRNDDYSLYRFYLHTDFRYANLLRLFLEGNGDYIDGYRRNPPPTPVPSDRGDLHQAFLEISPLSPKNDDVALSFRIGRQELSLDTQKLVGSFDWANTRRTFDGLNILFQVEDYQAQAFWLRPVVVDDIHFDNDDDQTNFAGFHLSHWLFNKDNHFSFFTYYLNRSRNTVAAFHAPVTNFNPDGKIGDTDRLTIGSRFWGTLQQFDYDVEGGVQVGTFGGESLQPAGYVSTEFGYTLPSLPASPRLSIGYDYASGDDGRDNHAGTFDQLFPTGHLYFGYLDFVGRQNIDAGNVTLTLKPTDALKIWTTFHLFALADTHDALYNAPGQAIRFSPSGNVSSFVGDELDVTGSYQLGRHLSLLTGYCIFFPGDFLRETGKSDTAQMVFSSLEFKF